ncbi:WD40-repeat-containing domain protein [Radiomyces spectabilis]|uniref:WD40-repeat-containing domain protein n=1 Tax=Radiomyces spectabilis TaxID=64574 RepID=UPI002220B94F|nr:WD40-repeat-containing domain protein [Radiomyces spectabilis]KAI8388612.1 WD40-repeat-containing domain protein [Radiomyces spectabilis]
MASSISLPFVIWHNFTNPNTTSLACNPPHVYAGQKDGHIWVYQMSLDPPTLQHKFLLVGHKAPVVALCVIKNHTNSLSNDDVLISAAEDGEIARWSVVDGRCQAVNNSGFMGVPRYLKVFKQFSSRHIFCCGQSNDIFILNATTLEVVSVWGGHANWVVCTDFCPERILSSTGAQQQGQQPKLVTMTMDGRLDTWNFDVSKQIIYKDKSILHQPLSSDQTVSTFNAHFDLISSDSTPGICMALTDEKVVIFALHNNNEFIPHITLPAKSGTSWTGGVFCETNRLMIWTQNGDIYDYVLHPPQGVKTGSMASNEQQLYYTETLVQSYSMDENACGMPESRFTAVYEDTSDGMIALLSVANDIERSTYGIQITASDISTDINTTSPSPAKNLSLGWCGPDR